MRNLYFEDIDIDNKFPPLVKDPITKVQLVRYAGASGDFNPLHTDDTVGQGIGLSGVIAQGIMIMGFIGQAITDWVPKRFVRKFSTRLTAMTFPGDVITVNGIVRGKEIRGEENILIVDVTAVNQKGEIKASGFFETALPKKTTNN